MRFLGTAETDVRHRHAHVIDSAHKYNYFYHYYYTLSVLRTRYVKQHLEYCFPAFSILAFFPLVISCLITAHNSSSLNCQQHTPMEAHLFAAFCYCVVRGSIFSRMIP